jgi:hypothetical protein
MVLIVQKQRRKKVRRCFFIGVMIVFAQLGGQHENYSVLWRLEHMGL